MTARITAILLFLFGLGALSSIAVGSLLSGAIVLTALFRLVFIPSSRRWLPPREILLALGALLLTHLLATALSAPAPLRWDKWGEELWLELLLVAVPVLVAGRPGVARAAALAVLAGGAAAALVATFQFLTGVDPIKDRHIASNVGFFIATGFTGHHLSYGGQAVLTLVMALAWLRQSLLEDARHLLRPALVLPLLACLLLGLGLVWSFARSAQLGALVAAVYLVATMPRRWRLVGLGSLALVAVLALALPPVHQRVAEAFTDEKEVTRPNLWQSSLAGIKDRPLRGWGPGNFEAMMEQHEVPGFYEVKCHAHNDWLMFAVIGGLPGLAAAIWLWLATLRHLRRGLRRLAEPDLPAGYLRAAWVIRGAVACQIALAVAGVFQVYQTDDEPEMLLYFLIGCGLALVCRTTSTGKESTP
jgi:O-antigen ligase